MPLASDRQVNEKPFKIGTNSQNPPLFDPLSWEKTDILLGGIALVALFGLSGVFSGLAAMAISPFSGFLVPLSSIAGAGVGIVSSRILAN